jgi:uncharacterized protein (DUF1501 family)
MKQNRREFLAKSGCALTMLGLATQARHFGLMSAMAQTVENNAQTEAPPSDYRALVCVFMSGGNDANNMIVPKHNSTTGGISNYAAYTAARGAQGLALQQSELLSISVPRIGGLEYGLHWNLGTMIGRTDIADGNGNLGGTRNNGIQELFAQGKLAVVTNVGSLLYPMTRAQYQGNQVQKPYQLFSHSDQVAQYQTARSDRRTFVGWGGLISDARSNSDNPGALIPMITSIAGSQLFTNGYTTAPLAIASGNTSLSNALVLNGYGTDVISTARRNALNNLRAIDNDQQLNAAASYITNQAVQASQALSTFQEVTTVFPNTSLGNQLKQVARLIKKRTDLSINRQIFFVQIGGFDTHNNQVTSVTQGQNGLMIQLGQALRAFYDEMVAQGMQNNVTTFTMSDFSRTLIPAGTGQGVVGTDHAWGSHHFVMGGAVIGGDFYGVNTSNGTPYPTLVANGPDDTDGGSGARGRWIPTTSVDQYAATLAQWYGVPAWTPDPGSQMGTVFPNLKNFAVKNLGFLNP